MKCMVTNNGPHPVEKWADTVAEEISGLVQVDGNSDAAAAGLVQKREFGARVLKALVARFAHIKEICAACDDQKFNAEVEKAIVDVAAAARDTVFSQHFLREQTVLYLRDLLSRRFATAITEYRNWHAAVPEPVREKTHGHHHGSHDQR